MKLSNELSDLAKLRLPVNVLYERHVIDLKKMTTLKEGDAQEQALT